MTQKSHPKQLILGSSSPFRAEMLHRLGIPFVTASPEIDESAEDGEDTEALVERLAIAKAQAISSRFPDATVIGCDQLARFQNRAVGKPLDRRGAVEQLSRFSGKQVDFLSAMCVFAPALKYQGCETVETRVVFRTLSQTEIERYLDADEPFGCAGSFKSESLGISLLESMSSDDPTAIIGLPLISLSGMLRQCGFSVP